MPARLHLNSQLLPPLALMVESSEMKRRRVPLLLCLSALLVAIISACQAGPPFPATNTPSPTALPTYFPKRLLQASPAEAAYAAPFPSCEPEEVGEPFLPPGPEEIQPPEPGDHLRQRAEAQGLLIGAAAQPTYFDDPVYTAILAQEFNLITPENAMKWDAIHPAPGQYDFSQADAVLRFALQHGQKVRGHTLVWGQALPAWVLNGNYSREEWIQILCQHVKTVVSRYRGWILAWDVVNEGLANDGTLYQNHWLRAIGPEYIPMAFQWAHEADPQAYLFFNEHSAEGASRKAQALYVLLQALLAQGLPLHGVGLQVHTTLYGRFTPQMLQENLQRLAELGLFVHLTEMDVRLQYSRAPERAKLSDQAALYQQVFQACLQSPNCTALVTWGVTDRTSWITQFTGKRDAPLLFDSQGQPKPAYYAVLELLPPLSAAH